MPDHGRQARLETIARRAWVARRWERELATMPDGAARAALAVKLLELHGLLAMLMDRAVSAYSTEH